MDHSSNKFLQNAENLGLHSKPTNIYHSQTNLQDQKSLLPVINDSDVSEKVIDQQFSTPSYLKITTFNNTSKSQFKQNKDDHPQTQNQIAKDDLGSTDNNKNFFQCKAKETKPQASSEQFQVINIEKLDTETDSQTKRNFFNQNPHNNLPSNTNTNNNGISSNSALHNNTNNNSNSNHNNQIAAQSNQQIGDNNNNYQSQLVITNPSDIQINEIAQQLDSFSHQNYDSNHSNTKNAFNQSAINMLATISITAHNNSNNLATQSDDGIRRSLLYHSESAQNIKYTQPLSNNDIFNSKRGSFKHNKVNQQFNNTDQFQKVTIDTRRVRTPENQSYQDIENKRPKKKQVINLPQSEEHQNFQTIYEIDEENEENAANQMDANIRSLANFKANFTTEENQDSIKKQSKVVFPNVFMANKKFDYHQEQSQNNKQILINNNFSKSKTIQPMNQSGMNNTLGHVNTTASEEHKNNNHINISNNIINTINGNSSINLVKNIKKQYKQEMLSKRGAEASLKSNRNQTNTMQNSSSINKINHTTTTIITPKYEGIQNGNDSESQKSFQLQSLHSSLLNLHSNQQKYTEEEKQEKLNTPSPNKFPRTQFVTPNNQQIKRKQQKQKQKELPTVIDKVCWFDNFSQYNKPYRDYLAEMKNYKWRIKEKYKGMHLYTTEVPTLYFPDHGNEWYDLLKGDKIMRCMLRKIKNYDDKDKFEILLRTAQLDFNLHYSEFIPKSFIIDYSKKQYSPEEEEMLQINETKRQIYIEKTAKGLLGDGIQIVGNIEDYQQEFQTKQANGELSHYTNSPLRVLQQYIMNPLLIQGKKCDFRVFFTLVCSENYWIFLFHPGYLRFSLVKYTNDSDDFDIHTTHFAGYLEKMKNTPEYPSLLKQTRQSQQWFNEKFQEEYRQTDDDIDNIYKKMKKIITYSFLSGTLNNTIKKSKGHFHTFGCDILIDDLTNPWFIQANALPGLDYSGDDVKDPAIKLLCQNVIDLVLDLHEHWNQMDDIFRTNSFLGQLNEFELCYNEATQYNILNE